MFLTFLILLVIDFVGRSSSQTHFGDACQLNAGWDGVASETDSESRVLEIPESCLEGDIDWDYPRGNLKLSAVHSSYSYSLCMEDSWFTQVGGVVELTGGANNSLPVPKEEEPTCTQDVDGKTELMVIAPETLFYMITLKYRIVSP